MQPNKSYVLKGETCSGGKRSKERITVLPCANMSGTEKLPLLVIGKYQRPRCFTGMDLNRLPTQYKNQKRAWMDGCIFTTWVKQLDQKMAIRGRKICLVMDNCRAHPDVKGLKAIKIVFLPPNTTSHTQPMDQGIIQNLKVHYRHLLVKRGLLPAVEKKEEFHWTLLDALSALRDAWTRVKPATIANCFRHCGFQKPEQPAPTDEDDDPEDNIPLAMLAAQLRASGEQADEEAVRTFLEADDDLATSAALTDEGIIQEVKAGDPQEEESSDEEEEPEPEPQPKVTFSQAMDHLSAIRRFLMTLPSPLPRHDDHWKQLAALESEVDKSQHQLLKQKSIKDFFRQ